MNKVSTIYEGLNKVRSITSLIKRHDLFPGKMYWSSSKLICCIAGLLNFLRF